MINTKVGRFRNPEQRIEALKNEIRFLTMNNDLEVRHLIRNQPLNFLVEALESLQDTKILLRFLVVSHRIKMGALFLALSDENKLSLLEDMKSGVLVHLLDDLNSDDVYELISWVPPTVQKRIIFNASRQLKEELKGLKSFDFAQAGSIMNATYVTLHESMQIQEAINFLRIKKEEFDIGEEIYVVNSKNEIIGSVKTKDLMLTERYGDILDIVDKAFFSVLVNADIDEVIELFKKYSLTSLAVVNASSQLVGIITHQDVIPEIIDSNIEDVYKFYGIKETKKTYLNSSVLEIVRSRILCLIIMLFAATITTWVIDKFETLGVEWTAGISSAILVPIIPIITDMCGNTGSQTTATVIQAIAVGDIRDGDFWRVIRKELNVAAVVGFILALCNFLRLVVYFLIISVDKSKFHMQMSSLLDVNSVLTSLDSNGVSARITDSSVFKISLVGALSSSISLFLVVIFSKFFGVIVPFFAIKRNWDPASVSSPVLTTILDTISSLIFFGIGVALIHMTISPIFGGVTVDQGKLVYNAAATIMQTYSPEYFY